MFVTQKTYERYIFEQNEKKNCKHELNNFRFMIESYFFAENEADDSALAAEVQVEGSFLSILSQ